MRARRRLPTPNAGVASKAATATIARAMAATRQREGGWVRLDECISLIPFPHAVSACSSLITTLGRGGRNGYPAGR